MGCEQKEINSQRWVVKPTTQQGTPTPTCPFSWINSLRTQTVAITSTVYLKQTENGLTVLPCAGTLAEDDCEISSSPWPVDWLTNAPTSLGGHQSALALSLVNTWVLTHTYKKLAHIMSSTGAVLPTRLWGKELMRGRPANYNCSSQ